MTTTPGLRIQTGALLDVAGVTKRFGELRAVDGVSLTVERGQTVGLIGPNGAGKTTLFNLISGVLRPDAGEIRFENEVINRMPPDVIARRGLCRTFQNLRIFGRLTVLENLRVAREGHAARRTADALLEVTGLDDLRNEYARDLSFGQQKLLSIARVLMLEPTLVLLDEPMAGINPTLANDLLTLLSDQHRRGRAFLIIEHDMRVLMRVCQHVVALAEGRKIAEGRSEEVQGNAYLLDVYFGSRHHGP